MTCRFMVLCSRLNPTRQKTQALLKRVTIAARHLEVKLYTASASLMDYVDQNTLLIRLDLVADHACLEIKDKTGPDVPIR